MPAGLRRYWAARRRNPGLADPTSQLGLGERKPAVRAAFAGQRTGETRNQMASLLGGVFGAAPTPAQKRKQSAAKGRRTKEKNKKAAARKAAKAKAKRAQAARKPRKAKSHSRPRKMSKRQRTAGLRRYWAARRRALKAARRRHRGAYVERSGARARKRHKRHLRATRTIRPGQLIAGRVVRVNPRRRKPMSRRHHYRRRNPSGRIMQTARFIAAAAVPGMAGNAAMTFLDGKLAQTSMPIQAAVKTALTAVTAIALRRHPIAAASAIGGMLGPLAGNLVAKLQGGVTTTSAQGTMKALGRLVYSDPYARRQIAALVDPSGAILSQTSLRGMGSTALPDGPVGVNVTLG